LMTACEDNSGTGSNTGVMHLSITDAPIDQFDITGVFITVTEVQIHMGEENWMVIEDFDGPVTYNLLELSHGISELMASAELTAGNYTQIRFLLDAPVNSEQGNHSNPGCYLEFADGTTVPLFVPSGAETGYKATGDFTIPVNGEVHVTADFDVRKSVVVAGQSGLFILKPTIRLVVDDQAGNISGTIINLEEEYDAVIYAYEAGTYQESEAADPLPDTPRFPNAISSDMADEEGHFMIPFLAPGTYDLVVTTSLDGLFTGVLGMVMDVTVVSQQNTSVDIDAEEL
ncbi:MAG: DUF4382 domain-containing protein, partial [Bacteroidales bacterium]